MSVKASAPDDTDHSDVTFASEEEEELPPEEQSTVMRILRNGSMGSRSSSGAPVYEEVDSFSAESPRYAIMPQASYRVQPPPPAPSPPENNTTREASLRPQIEPEEETKTSPNSSSRDFLNESVKDFSIGSRKSSSPDPSGDRPRALPAYSVGSASDDISNDELFQEVSRAQSYVTQDSKVSEELDEPRIFIPQQYDVMQGSRHNLNSSSNLSPLNEDSKEGRRSSDSQLRSRSGSERSASRSGSEHSGSRQSGSRQSGSYQSGSRQSGSKYSSEESQELEQIPPPPVYRPTKAVRQKSQSSLRSKSKSKSRSRSGSRGKSRNGSRESRRSKSRGNPDVYTDSDHDSAEGSPPPTISDSGKSHRSNLSGFSQGSPATQSRSKSTRSGKKKNGPPPPPFQREFDESPQPQYFSDKQNRRPVTSVFTKSGSFGDESVVSDPTLDACFHNVPAPVPTRNTASAQIPRNRSDPSFDKDKSVTSSPPEGSRSSGQYRRSSSDELPPSEENVPNGSEGSGNEQVDNIVAAALAYAEKTHSLSSVPQGSSPAPQSHKAKKRQSGSSRRRRRKSDPEIRESQTSGASSGLGSAAVSGASLHSFYSGDKPNEKTSQEDLGDSIRSNPTLPSVADMVSAALAYAEESRGRGRGAAQKPATEKSEKSQSSSKHSSKHTKSVGSMFSDSDYDSEADEKSEFDC